MIFFGTPCRQTILEIHYHPGKANVVADALSRKSYVNMAVVSQIPQVLIQKS
jgi:hypothetical protein